MTKSKLQINDRFQNLKRSWFFGFRPLDLICNLSFGFRTFDQKGITLLLVVVLLSAILSISIGIFNVVIGEFRISGEATDSFRALYAADQGIERTLYQDRMQEALCTVAEGTDCFVAQGVMVPSEACYTVKVSKLPTLTTIVIAGQYRCGPSPSRVVKRGFEVAY